MTNHEYEAACVTAAGCYDRFEGEHKLKAIDEHIAQVEKTLASLHEMRREIVNQYSLNKAEGRWSGRDGKVQQIVAASVGKGIGEKMITGLADRAREALK